jgi:hypothetical protein
MSSETPNVDADPSEATLEEPSEAPVDEPPPEKAPRPPSRGQLRRRRRRLLGQREEVVYHLGGLAFELYRRDLLTEPVMRRRAEEVAELDRSVREIDERLEELAERPPRRPRQAAPTAGVCPSCGTETVVDARFCFSCGLRLGEPPEPDPSETPTGLIEPAEEPTSVIPREREEGP